MLDVMVLVPAMPGLEMPVSEMLGADPEQPAAEGRPRRALRRLYAALLRTRFRWFQSHRYRRLVLERVSGLDLVVLPEVFNPGLFRTGPFLIDSLEREVAPVGRTAAGGTVLELGTGTGIGAISIARRGRPVVATDVSSEAVRCARINCMLHRVEDQVDLRPGDLFAPVAGQRFETIVFHPPFWGGEPSDESEIAFRAGDLAPRFALGLADHLEEGGTALLLLSTEGRSPGFLGRLAECGFSAQPARSRDLGNEVLTLYRVARTSEVRPSR